MLQCAGVHYGAKKHVLLEKPLCLNQTELNEITETYREAQKNGVTLTVGITDVFLLSR